MALEILSCQQNWNQNLWPVHSQFKSLVRKNSICIFLSSLILTYTFLCRLSPVCSCKIQFQNWSDLWLVTEKMGTTTSNFVLHVSHHGRTTVCILGYFGRISSRIPRISKYQKLSAHGVDIKLRIMSLSQFNSIWASTAFQYKFFHPMLLFYVFKILVLDIFVSILFLFIRKTSTRLSSRWRPPLSWWKPWLWCVSVLSISPECCPPPG